MLELTESGSMSEGWVDPMSAPTSTFSMKKGRDAMRSAKQTAQLAVVGDLKAHVAWLGRGSPGQTPGANSTVPIYLIKCSKSDMTI